MAAPKLSASATVTQTTELSLELRVKQMLSARCEENARLAKQAKDIKARQARIQKEVEELLTKAGQDGALADGLTIDGHRIKRVGGTTRTLDKMALLQVLDITPEELDAFYDEKPKRAYLKITAPGERDGGDE